jgi:hypothetical protein
MVKYNFSEPENSFIEVEFEQGELSGTKFVIEKPMPCMDLNCSCGNIYFKDNSSPKEYSLDVNYSSVFRIDKEDDDDILAKSIENEIKEADWAEFYDFYSKLKGAAIEMIPAEDINYTFEDKDIQDIKKGYLFPFDKAFPWAFAFKFEIGEDKYEVRDWYCMNPTCGCTKAVLHFYKGENYDAVFSIDYNYQTKRYEEIEVFEKGIDTKPLIDELKKTNQERINLFTPLRHDKLKKLFRKSNKSSIIAPNNIISPYKGISRNDLCPCGSGLKFKKCHGA